MPVLAATRIFVFVSMPLHPSHHLQQQQAKERKARMQEMDRERQKKVPPTESEVAQREKDVGILSKAQA